jgi:hypothetical protein
MASQNFPAYVHSVVPNADAEHWPIQRQGINECGCTAPANALNLLLGQRRFDKDQFLREAGLFFQRNLGGSPSPITGWLIKRQGFGTHFGSLRRTDCEAVLRDLIDRRVPVVLELGANTWGPLTIYGQHSVVLVGYSERYTDAGGQVHEEYYFVDAQYPNLGCTATMSIVTATACLKRIPATARSHAICFYAIFPPASIFRSFPARRSTTAGIGSIFVRPPRLR